MSKKEKLVDKAQKFVQKGNLDKALAEYLSALSIDPKDISIRLRIGDLHVKLDNKDEAITEYTEVAKTHTQKGFYLKAIAVYKQILKLDESIIDVHYKLADLYTKQRLITDAISEYSFIINHFEKKGNSDEVIKLVKMMVDIDPNNVGVKLKLADMHMKKGFHEDALKEYNEIFDKLMEEGKLDKAEKIYLGVVQEIPKDKKVLEGLSTIFKQKGDVPNYVKYARELLKIYKEAGEIDKVRDIGDSILEVNPDDVETLVIISELSAQDLTDELEALSEIDIEEVEEIEELAPAEESAPVEEITPEIAVEPVVAEPEVVEEVAIEAEPEVIEEVALEVEVEETSPVEELEIEVEDEPSVEVAPVEELEIEVEDEVQVAEVEQEGEDESSGFVDLVSELDIEDTLDALVDAFGGHDSQETKEEFKEGLEQQRAQEDSETHYNMGIAYMEMEMHEEAFKEFKIALKDPKLEYDCLSRMGLTAMRMGNAEDAITYLEKAVIVEGRNDAEIMGARYELGLSYEMAGLNDKALEQFKIIAEEDPTFREVSEKISGGGSTGIPSDDDIVEVEIV